MPRKQRLTNPVIDSGPKTRTQVQGVPKEGLPSATHLVVAGHLRYPVYQAGDTMRDIVTGRIVAQRVPKGEWSETVVAHLVPRHSIPLLNEGHAVKVDLGPVGMFR